MKESFFRTSKQFGKIASLLFVYVNLQMVRSSIRARRVFYRALRFFFPSALSLFLLPDFRADVFLVIKLDHVRDTNEFAVCSVINLANRSEQRRRDARNSLFDV